MTLVINGVLPEELNSKDPEIRLKAEKTLSFNAGASHGYRLGYQHGHEQGLKDATFPPTRWPEGAEL